MTIIIRHACVSITCDLLMCVSICVVNRFDSSYNEMDDSGSDDKECKTKGFNLIWSTWNNIIGSALIDTKYYLTYLDKIDARTIGPNR